MGNGYLVPVETRWTWFNWPGWARWGLTLSFLALVNWLMLAPAGVFRGIHLFLAHQDKVAHFGIFLALAFLVRWSIPAAVEHPSFPRVRGGEVQVAAIVLLVLYAGSIEAFQPLLAKAGRHFEWLDVASNYGGLCAGWLSLGWLTVGSRESSGFVRGLSRQGGFAFEVDNET